MGGVEKKKGNRRAGLREMELEMEGARCVLCLCDIGGGIYYVCDTGVMVLFTGVHYFGVA
jgi:hypothetical protein